MLMSGINNGVLLREICELSTWAGEYFSPDVMLSKTFGTALDIIRSCGEGCQTWMEPKRIRLPSSTGNHHTT
jgi:hypothetical protein